MSLKTSPSLLSWKNNAEYVTADEQGHVQFWDVDSDVESRKLAAHEGPINSLCFDQPGNLLATASGNEIK